MWLRACPQRHGSCVAPAAARTLFLRTACQARASLWQSPAAHVGAGAFWGGGQLENSSVEFLPPSLQPLLFLPLSWGISGK